MERIKVNKQELLNKLKENREIHIKEYKEMFTEYQKETIKILQKVLREAKKVPELKQIPTYIGTQAPESSEKEYDVVIGMLEFSTQEDLEITQKEYKQYVLNEWNWSHNFEMLKASYGV